MLLTFQINDNKDSIEILFDKEGLDFFKSLINKSWHEPICKEDGLYDLDHEHLLSNSWGGDELTPEFTSDGSKKVESVKIVYLGKQGEKIIS